METVLKALALIADPYTLGVMLLASMFGLFVGAIPGLTATMATALLIPFTFFMDPVPAIAAIVATVATAIFAGDIPGALLRIPGTPASAAYCDEAYAMTRKGLAERALGIALVTSVIGGLAGSIVLSVSAPALAEFAIQFSSFEYFWLACLGLSCAVIISTGSTIKGFVSLLLGLFIATIGIDGTAGHPRFTFGNVELMGGVSFIPAMIGMFAISEVLRYVASTRQVIEVPQQSMGSVLTGLGPDIVQIPVQHRTRQLHWRRGGDIAGCWSRYSSLDLLCHFQEAIKGTGEIRHRTPGRTGGCGIGQQCEPCGGVGPGDRVRHSRRLHHRHRDRRALHERHEPGTDGVHPES